MLSVPECCNIRPLGHAAPVLSLAAPARCDTASSLIMPRRTLGAGAALERAYGGSLASFIDLPVVKSASGPAR